jgi:hypothetical protein
MNVWIDAIVELTGIGRGGMGVSLSDLGFLLPDLRWLVGIGDVGLLVVGAVAVFCLAAAYRNACTDRREDKEPNTDRR